MWPDLRTEFYSNQRHNVQNSCKHSSTRLRKVDPSLIPFSRSASLVDVYCAKPYAMPTKTVDQDGEHLRPSVKYGLRCACLQKLTNTRWHYITVSYTKFHQNRSRRRVQLKCDGTRWRTGGEVKVKLANGVGSQYSSHYLGTWCIQHYYRWSAHLGCQ